MENWKQIPFAPNYAVSDLGNVKRITAGRRTRPDLPRKTWVKSRGNYLLVTLRLDGKNKSFLVHRLVMRVFVGESPLQVNHKNGNKHDNRLENLEYVDGAANRAHAMHVLNAYAKGEKHPNSKLTEAEVIQIKQMIAAGVRDKDIGQLFGCTPTNVYYIRKGTAWAHVSAGPRPAS